jgi:hypothetical protein
MGVRGRGTCLFLCSASGVMTVAKRDVVLVYKPEETPDFLENF